MFSKVSKEYLLFKKRREKLVENIRQENSYQKDGVVVLFAAFEDDRYAFRQDSTFFYFTGVEEPAAVLLLYLDGREILYIPNYGESREKWMITSLGVNKDSAKKIGVDEVKNLGQQSRGYSLSPLFLKPLYENLLVDLGSLLSDKNKNIFGLFDLSSNNLTQVIGFQFLTSNLPGIKKVVCDISSIVYSMRRKKEKAEIDYIQRAIDITCLAYKEIAKNINSGVLEYEIQAQLEYVFAKNKTTPAFPSIVAGGKNATILHYTKKDKKLKDGDLVVVDIGAECRQYAADLTRTFPVGGKFNDRQREVYKVVLETQKFIENLARPGMYLNNPKDQERSLQHIAREFLRKAGYLQYFFHGIGHFLGLDVHDVGNMAKLLECGDLITIEPGVYISEENLGIRIEDDFLITEDGCRCLSKQLPKELEEVEKMMR